MIQWLLTLVADGQMTIEPYTAPDPIPDPIPGPAGRKWYPGHYVKTQGNHADKDQADYMAGVLKKCADEAQQVTGAYVAFGWGMIEQARGIYNFSQVDEVLGALNGKKLILDLPYKSFSSDTTYLAPDYLQNEVHQTTRVGTSIIRVWDPNVMDDYIDLISAVADRYDGHPDVSLVTWSESAPSLRGDRPSGYSPANLADELIRLYHNASSVFHKTPVTAMINFLSGQTGRLVQNAYDLGLGRSGPDLRDEGAFSDVRDLGLTGKMPHMAIWSHSAANDGNGDTDNPADALSWALKQGVTHLAWVSSFSGEDSWENILAAIEGSDLHNTPEP